MKKFLLGLVSFCCWFPPLLLADGLTPPTSDLSMSYLATIFGVVDGVLHGTGSGIIGTMFGTFNAIVLVVASVILSYILFISILNTSHEGEFLGKKWSSIWVPLRTVTGIGLLLPKATGYSFVQIIVMWVVVQGVGAADQVWNVALGYMNRNGTIVEPIQSLSPKGSGVNNTFLINKSGDILKSEVCMLTVYNSFLRQYRDKGVGVPDFMSSLEVTGKGPNGQNTFKPIDYVRDKGGFISFPGHLQGTGVFENLTGMCGSVSWDFVGNSDQSKLPNPANLAANDSASIAVRQMTLDLAPLAKSIANELAPPYAAGSSVLPITLRSENPIFVAGALIDTSNDYFAIVKPALRSLADNASKEYKEFISQAKASGWILAGSYYYNMARLNQSVRKNTGQLAMSDKIYPSFNPNYDTGGFNQINDANVIANLKNNLPGSSGGVIDSYIDVEKQRAANSNNPGSDSEPSLPGRPASVTKIGDIVSAVLNTIFPRVQDFAKTLSDNINNKDMDPIFALASVGNGLVTMVEAVWISALGVMTTLGIAGIVAGVASGFWTAAGAVNAMLAITNLLILIAPLVTIWMSINLVLGSVLSYYVPLIPFFLFTFGAITWFAVVLEAVIAAPLVALGITHPEGHDFMGKAEQSIMLLMSVFLRPVLMVFGFIFGIMLSFVGLSLFNRGFGVAVQFLTEYNGDILAIVSQTAMMAIYTAAILAIVNRSFSMIYEVPNKVLRWIGGPQESGHEESMLQGIRGQHDRDVGQIAQQVPSGQGLSESSAGGMQLGRRLKELKQTKGDASPGADPASNSGGTAGGGGG